jgi:hypothetical protein
MVVKASNFAGILKADQGLHIEVANDDIGVEIIKFPESIIDRIHHRRILGPQGRQHRRHQMTHVSIVIDEQKFQVFNVVIRHRQHPLAQSGDIISKPHRQSES